MVSLLFLLAWFAGTHPDWGVEVRRYSGIFLLGMVDELRGPPDADAIAKSRRFEEDGIAFDYPAVLRPRLEEDEQGERTWSFEYGMFTLEYRSSAVGVRTEDFLGVMVDLFEGGRSIDAEGPMPGRSVTLCGENVEATRIRVKLMGDWSSMEGFDLPGTDADGRVRSLVFDDEEVGGGESRLARETYARVLGSLTCTTDEA